MQTSSPRLEEVLNLPSTHFQTKGWEQLFIYLAISEGAISAVLIREEEGKQFLVYYVNKSLLHAETHYTQLEKLALTLVTIACKRWSYF